MAINKLERDGTEVSLVGGTDGIRIQRGGYRPVVVQRNPDGEWPRTVDEVLELMVEGSDKNDLAANSQALVRMLNGAADFGMEMVDGTPTWWHQQLDNETQERRAHVWLGRTEVGSSVYGPPTSPGDFMEAYQVGIRRGAFWERTSSLTGALMFLASGGDSGAYVAVAGDAPARINNTVFFGVVGAAALSEFWVGFRTERFGDPSKFQPVWQCEDAGSVGADTSDTGSELTCTFSGTTTLAERFAFKLSDVISTSGDEDEHRGRFFLLLRAQVTGGLVARVRMKSGYRDTAVWREHDFTTIDNANNFFYPLGEVQIPPRTRHITVDEGSWKDEEYFGIGLDAEVVSGSGNLLMDRIVAIPQAEGWCHVRDGYVYNSGSGDWRTVLQCTPRDEFVARLWGGQTTAHSPYYDADQYFLPARQQDGYVVYAAQGSSASVATDNGGFYFTYYPRWEMLAGSGA